MHVTSEHRLDDHVLERRFTVGDIPGILWTPETPAEPTPLILVGHPGGLDMMYPRVSTRARHAVAAGYAAATIELPGSGARPRSADAEKARAELRHAVAVGEPVTDDVVDRLVLPLVEKSVPEWQSALDAVLELPEICGPVGYSGGVIAIGVRLAVVEPRIAAALLYAGSFLPRSMFEEGASCRAVCSRRRGRPPFHYRFCCNGTTKETTDRWRWICSTPSGPRRKRCTPT